MSIKIKVERELSDDFVSSVLITAFDGSYGGCWYWAEPSVDDWLKEDGDLWTSCSVRDRDDTGVRYVVNAEVIQAGIQRILDIVKFQINDDIRGHTLRGVLEEDAGEIDSIAADCIVQAGLFNEIVYG